jgi:DNA-directed RNA polymerase subunit L
MNSLSKVIETLISKNNFTEVCKYVVEPSTSDMNTFKVTIHLDESKLSELRSLRSIAERVDEIVNKTWEIAYDFLDIPLNIYTWRVKNC